MRALPRKLLRDLWRIRGQAAAIALVIAAGVSMNVMYLSLFDSLRLTQRAYYERYRFADAFAAAERVPRTLLPRIEAIPGVRRVEARVAADVTLDVPGLAEPASARLLSMPERRRPALDDVFLRSGRWIQPERADEALVSEGFALAHGLGPGDSVAALINGRRRDLEIVGVALSPEYVYSIRPGDLIPDDERFAVLWMGERALSAAFDMEGAFNDVALSLSPGARTEEVLGRLDRLLAPYGGLGAVPRELQTSHWYLENELEELQTVGRILPAVFLAVAVFLLNVVLARIVAVQREEIAALKALGYGNRAIGLHYVAWGLVIAGAGVALGLVAGAVLGSRMMGVYNEYFRFPELVYRLNLRLVVGTVALSLAAAVAGTLAAVRQAVALPPAEAMRPEPPGVYRRTWLEGAAAARLLSTSARMVLRNLSRRPLRALLSVVGISLAAAMMVTVTFFIDSMDELLDVAFRFVQRQDVTVTFVQPASAAALHEVERLPGVLAAEPLRAVPVRLRHGHRSRQVAVLGLPARPRLHRVLDADLDPVVLPDRGLVVSSKLAEILGAGEGDRVTLEVLEGARPVRRAVVARVVEEYLGTNVYMEIDALHALLREGGTLSGANLLIDPASSDALYRRLKATPRVAGVTLKRAALDRFAETLDRTLGAFIAMSMGFAGIIAFGVLYNAARISLSERSRDLASLRVLGFTRREVAEILLGELALLTGLALPLGLALGRAMAAGLVRAFDEELFRLPLVVLPRTYALAVVTVVAAAVLSGWVVRRRLDRLDLVAVLKTRE